MFDGASVDADMIFVSIIISSCMHAAKLLYIWRAYLHDYHDLIRY